MTEPADRLEVSRAIRRVLGRALTASILFWFVGTAFFVWANTGALSSIGPTHPGTLGLIGFITLVGLVCLNQWRWSRLVAAVLLHAHAATPVTITFGPGAPNLAIIEAGSGAGGHCLALSVMRVTRTGQSLGWRSVSSHSEPRTGFLYADFAKRVGIAVSGDDLFVPRRRWVYRAH